jgi:hypothetical protein
MDPFDVLRQASLQSEGRGTKIAAKSMEVNFHTVLVEFRDRREKNITVGALKTRITVSGCHVTLQVGNSRKCLKR